ncbi:MAG: hypothetical protein K0U68_12415 [Gammaproteobacteria bacterium]|nr:hypothetical protein [Gammaproteobacteria bacterium]
MENFSWMDKAICFDVLKQVYFNKNNKKKSGIGLCGRLFVATQDYHLAERKTGN